jgi:asparagine synthase (glutamine-hydrolysing)
MCGITGFIDYSAQSGTDRLSSIVDAMTDTLANRGPDDRGKWVEEAVGIALGHRRLSILDLSVEGHQPMICPYSGAVIVFNGEIYNYLELRRELITFGYKFRSNSDTEVMLACFHKWGVVAAATRFIGMFAFAFWDRKEQVLHLGRDRLGEKPLYYGWMGNTFLFASELKALKAYPQWVGEINRDAVALLMRHNYITAPHSIYKNIYKLLPGTLLTIDGRTKTHPDPVAYWSIKEVAEFGVNNPFSGSDGEAIEQLDSLLRDAISRQMVADVPLGAFLSGGIDSSAVVALMQAQSSRPVKTFSIGFNENEYNEAPYAQAVAQHLGTDHTELYVTPAQAIAVIPQLASIYDEPFADSSQIPTFLVSQLARQQVTVSLSGDGGDELFAGYNRYFWGRQIWQQIGWMPVAVRKVIARTLKQFSPQNLDRALGKLPRLKQRQVGDKLHKVAEVLGVESPEIMYMGLVSHWKHPQSLVIGASEANTPLSDRNLWASLPEFTRQMMYLDSVTYLPDDILTKVDRASMGVSLESRVPFLDHRVVEFAWRIPLELKIRHGESKWLLRQVLSKYIPSSLINRPKMGFGIPIDDWLRHSLRDWAESLLDERRLQQEGFFQPQPIREKWLEHLSTKSNWQYHLWDVLMFQAWLEQEKNL